MTEYQLKKRISQLEKQLTEKKQDNNFRKEVCNGARQLKILFEEFEKQGFSKEFIQSYILKLIK